MVDFKVCFVLVILTLSCVTNGELNFLIVADWGGDETWPYYTPAQRYNAEQMGKTANQIGSQFTVALGDNFYPLGVKDVDDSRFKSTFEDVFTADSLQSRWYVIAGNHDHYGNASAEIAYTARSKRWYMPNYYYTETVTIPNSSDAAQFIFIDTIILNGVTDPVKKWLPPRGPASVSAAEDQWEWIEQTLAASTAKWLFVLGHYPVWSICEHGPTQTLVNRLRPLLIKYNVTAYFSGHDHAMQHFHEENSTVEYFVTGAGHDTDPSKRHLNDVPPNSLQFHYAPIDIFKTYGAFSSVSLSPTVMNVTYIEHSGKELYFYSNKPTRV